MLKKKQIGCGLAWSVLLSTMIRVITVVKMLWTREAQPSKSSINWATSQSARFALVSEYVSSVHPWANSRCRISQSERALCISYVINSDKKTCVDDLLLDSLIRYWFARFVHNFLSSTLSQTHKKKLRVGCDGNEWFYYRLSFLETRCARPLFSSAFVFVCTAMREDLLTSQKTSVAYAWNVSKAARNVSKLEY